MPPTVDPGQEEGVGGFVCVDSVRALAWLHPHEVSDLFHCVCGREKREREGGKEGKRERGREGGGEEEGRKGGKKGGYGRD